MRNELQQLVIAIENLSRIKDGETLFEHQPTKDAECAAAWRKLNDAVAQARTALAVPDEGHNALAQADAACGVSPGATG